MHSNTVRILSLDGGGVRGYLSLKFLQRFIRQWGVNPNELWKYFDVIAGTSIGGIQALGYAFGKSPYELESFFLEKAKRIFTVRSILDVASQSNNASTDSLRPSQIQKVGLIAKDEPFYQSLDENSNYGHNILHEVLENNFADSRLTDLKTKVVIPAYDQGQEKYVIFSNHSNFQGKNAKIIDIARSTSAAPVYLPSYKFKDADGEEREYVDGGIYQNNPAEIALSLGKALKPTANRYCVLSLGTGIGDMGFDESNESNEPNETPATSSLDMSQVGITTDGVVRIFKLFDIASTGGQESVDFNLKLRSMGTLEQLHYYRFQPRLDKALDTELDNSDPSFLEYMKDTANAYYDDDTININNFIGHLTA